MHKILFLAAMLLSVVTGCSSNDNAAVETPALSFLNANTEEGLETVTLNALGGERMVKVTANVDWTVASSAEWLTLSNRSGVPTATEATAMYLKLSATKNETGAPRTALVTLQGQGVARTLTVNQAGTADVDAHGFQLATTALAQMGNGMNIGNTLDSYSNWVSGTNPKDYETAWGNPQITPQLIAAYKNAGIKALRLPVTWRQHIDEDGNVNALWMARVKEVVDYIVNEGMYCILNVHHDCGGDDGAWLRAYQDEDNLEKAERKFKGLWTNIATEFQDYGDRLLFEGYNEMLDGNLSWTSTDSKGYAALNQLAQTFVNTVRATGGNNAHRNLIVCTYGADAHETTLSAFTFPTDPTENHLIAEVHVYTPDEFVSPSSAEEAKPWGDGYAAELDESFSLIDKYLASKGIPVVIGEFGCNGNVPEADQVAYTQHFLSKASALGIPSFHWFDLIDRNTCEWTLPGVAQTLVK